MSGARYSAEQLRHEVAALAQQYRAQQMDFRGLLMALPVEVDQTEDEDICELLDLIEHEPGKGGFLGVAAFQHAEHMARIDALIVQLSRNAIENLDAPKA